MQEKDEKRTEGIGNAAWVLTFQAPSWKRKSDKKQKGTKDGM
jgi:hypothetical protein